MSRTLMISAPTARDIRRIALIEKHNVSCEKGSRYDQNEAWSQICPFFSRQPLANEKLDELRGNILVAKRGNTIYGYGIALDSRGETAGEMMMLVLLGRNDGKRGAGQMLLKGMVKNAEKNQEISGLFGVLPRFLVPAAKRLGMAVKAVGREKYMREMSFAQIHFEREKKEPAKNITVYMSEIGHYSLPSAATLFSEGGANGRNPDPNEQMYDGGHGSF